MAHGLGFAFVDFFDSDPRGVIPPVYTATLTSNASAMLINGHPIQLYVQLASAANSSTVRNQLDRLPPYSMLWLRKGRQAFVEPSLGCEATANDEVCYAALWLRERFWRAVLARKGRGNGAGPHAISAHTRRQRPERRRKSLVRTTSNTILTSQHENGDAEVTVGRPIRIAVHVRRGDVYYLGPKTRRPHPHWVETATVLDMIAGAQRALGRPLESPGVLVDVFSEVGWLKNDTAALLTLAPDARIHLDSAPSATVNALIQMSQADLLIMGSSGFSFWAGIFSCGVKVGFVRENSAPLPMRFVKYASTITTKSAPFWPAAGQALRNEWTDYWKCRRDPFCRPKICGPQHLTGGSLPQGSVWTRSRLAQKQLADVEAVQWNLPELVLWPKNGSAGGPSRRMTVLPTETKALGELRSGCNVAAAMK